MIRSVISEFKGGGRGSTAYFSCEDGGILPQIVINLPGIYEKLQCKGESIRFNG